PHRITIVLGMLSPLLAVVAIAFSAFSLSLNNEVIHTSQRAYLGLKLQPRSVSEMKPFSDQFADLLPQDSSRKSFFEMEVTNSGNTPAEDISFDIDPTVSNGLSSVMLVAYPHRIQPKATFTIRGQILWQKDVGLKSIEGHLEYLDTFGKRQREALCYLYLYSDKDGKETFQSCGSRR